MEKNLRRGQMAHILRAAMCRGLAIDSQAWITHTDSTGDVNLPQYGNLWGRNDAASVTPQLIGERLMSTAKKSAKGKSKSKSTKPATRPLNADGDHKEGSRKGKVHELFNKDGPEAAWVLGLKLKLKEGTLRSWFAAWKRLQGKGKNKVESNSAVAPATTPEILAA